MPFKQKMRLASAHKETSVMNLVPKQIWKSTYNYYSDQSVDILKADIQQLFDQKEGWTSAVNLTGGFTSEYEFSMIPKWQFTNINGFEQKASHLNGRIYQNESEKTRVEFSVRPNSTLAIFFFVFPFIGLIVLLFGTSDGEENDNAIGGPVFILVVPLVMMMLGHFAKQGIKDTFIRVFNLKQMD